MKSRILPGLFLLITLIAAGTCHLENWQDAPISSTIVASPTTRLQPEPDFEARAEQVAPGIQFTMPVRRSASMQFTSVAPISGEPKATLDKMLREEECNMPAIVKWRDQWRGDCLTPVNRRIRIALVKGPAGWAGLRIDYADVNNLGLAPFAKRILDSGHPVD